MKSILQEDQTRCYLCGGPATADDPLDLHHVFPGPLRRKSEKLGLVVRLHHSRCHIFGPESVHQCAEVSRALKALAQKRCMEVYGWTMEQWMDEFYKNYLEDDENDT